jgi:hypothetical protein
VVDSLPPGETAFSVVARYQSGESSNPARILWAAAARFDAAFVVYENNAQNVNLPTGIDLGSAIRNPATLVIDPTVQPFMDIYLYGGAGQPLALQSASLYLASWNVTFFSTVTTTSASLDYYLSSFPSISTFTQLSVPVADSTVYYVRVSGDNGAFNYGRVQVGVVPGLTYPDRAVEVRISLQRVPGLPYADASPSIPVIHDATNKVPIQSLQ